jgi:hypothetical protein
MDALSIRLLALALSVGLLSCSAPQTYEAPTISTSESYTDVDDSLLSEGMSFDEVEARWGDTDCVYQVKVQDQFLDALGYGLHADSGEVIGLPDCRTAVVSLYFNDGRLTGWGEHE